MASGKQTGVCIVVSVVIRMIYIWALTSIFHSVYPNEDVWPITCVTYCIIYLVLRYAFGYHHFIGISKYKQKRYADAVNDFIKSYIFFAKYKWIDKYRLIFLMSASSISYREMALLNAASCFGQLGDIQNSTLYYERALVEFPNSELAMLALNFINAAKGNA